jgi:hypothetical protein
VPSLRDVAHDGALCTFSNRSAPELHGQVVWSVSAGTSEWIVRHEKNHTLLGHSSPASQADRRIGPAL